MLKLIARFFLSLLILLSSGYGRAFTLNHQDSHEQYHTKSVDSSFSQFGIDSINKSSSSSESRHLVIEVTENESEEEEFNTARKYLEISDYFTNLFNAQSHGYFLHYLKKRLPFCKHFSNLSSDWSLFTIFRVFRI
jgi:hypothetical protein